MKTVARTDTHTRLQDEFRGFCTVAEAADMLGVSASTIWRWIDADRLPAFRLGPKAIRIRRSDVEAAVHPVARRVEETTGPTGSIRSAAAPRRLTKRQADRGLAALAAAGDLRRSIRRRRKGRPLPDSAALIRAARDARPRGA
ncbi:MAG: helix-turn-helix domain-containing protein [Dehalococcoidia bacterium]